MEIEKGKTIEFEIADMLDDGRAFGRYEGCAVFVCGGCDGSGDRQYAGAVPGDFVRAEITKAKKKSAEAVLKEIVSLSPDRIDSECKYFGQCGGCTLQELSYETQVRMKQEQVKAKLARLGELEDPKVNETVRAETLKYYRNKATFAIGPHGEIGFMKGKSHFVMDIDDCLLQSDAAMVCAEALRVFLRERRDERAANEPHGITQMTVRTAFGTGEVMVVLETKRKEIAGVERLIEMLDDAVSSINGCSLESVALIYGADPKRRQHGKCDIIAAKQTITDEFIMSDGGTVKYEISPQSFFQVNPEQMVKLYDMAAEYADLRGGETMLDLYCGAGTIGIWLLKKMHNNSATGTDFFEGARVIGIESVKPAVIDANRNSVINGLVNTRYICGKAEEELPGMMGLAKLYKWNEVNERVEREPEISISGIEEGKADATHMADPSQMKVENVDIAILDPPRAGCDEALLAAVAAAQPDRIVYVSCDPGTLARDIKYLTAKGYDFIEATPVDMFPQTSSIETVVLLVRKMSRSER